MTATTSKASSPSTASKIASSAKDAASSVIKTVDSAVCTAKSDLNVKLDAAKNYGAAAIGKKSLEMAKLDHDLFAYGETDRLAAAKNRNLSQCSSWSDIVKADDKKALAESA